jgi:hypothetical protein
MDRAMMVDTTVYALLGDGYIVHNHEDCAPNAAQAIDGRHQYIDLETGAELQPIYYLDDDGRGMTCDHCTLYIFEPSCPECGDDAPGTDDQGEPELCGECRDTARTDADLFVLARDPDTVLADWKSDKYREAFDERRDELALAADEDGRTDGLTKSERQLEAGLYGDNES